MTILVTVDNCCKLLVMANHTHARWCNRAPAKSFNSILDIRRVGGGLLRDACRHLGSKGQTCESSWVFKLPTLGASGSHPAPRWRRSPFPRYLTHLGRIWNLYVRVHHTFSVILSPYPPHVAALVKVPSVGVAIVKDTAPMTPVSVTVQVSCTHGMGGCFG